MPPAFCPDWGPWVRSRRERASPFLPLLPSLGCASEFSSLALGCLLGGLYAVVVLGPALPRAPSWLLYLYWVNSRGRCSVQFFRFKGSLALLPSPRAILAFRPLLVADFCKRSNNNINNNRGNTSTVLSYLIDTPGQLDVILGDAWLRQANAIINDESNACSVLHKGNRLQLPPVVANAQDDDPSPSNINTLPLNAVQLEHCIRTSARVFMGKVSDSGKVADEQPPDHSPRMASLISEYKGVFSPVAKLPPMRDTGHTISTKPGEKPPFRPMIRLSPTELEEVERQVAGLLKHGLIEPSSSPHGDPVLFMTKKDGSLRNSSTTEPSTRSR